MDPASTSLTPPEQLEEAASSDHPPTRPNPFDDTEISSRKRRRTSVPGSPAASLDTVNPVHDGSSSATLDGDQPVSASAMNVDDSPDTPRTPEPGASREGTPAEPPSSRVTINLRKRRDSASPSAARVSPVPRSGTRPVAREMSGLDESAEAPGAVMDTARQTNSGSPKSSSLSTSPPVELVNLTEDDGEGDDDMAFSATGPEADTVSDYLLLVDPTLQFPYTEPEESLCDTLQRLTQYISTSTPVDGTILGQVVEWLEEYIKFAQLTDSSTVLESRRAHRSFWAAFPDVMLAVASRKSELVKLPVLGNAVLAIYTSFATLTARFVILDYLAIREVQSASASADRRVPDLLAPVYLQQVHGVIAPYGFAPHTSNDGATGVGWSLQELESYLVGKFQSSPGGSIDCLSQFASALTGIIPQFPRLADSLAPVSQILADCMRDSARTVRMSQDGATQAKRRLEVGYKIWDNMSASLTATIDKHVTSLNSDCAASEIQALTEILKLSLQSDCTQAVAILKEHQSNYPALAPKYTYEAIAWEWKVGILEKLIRSSQMQLRVMAVTTLCTHLVAIWKRLSDGGEEYSADFLNHLAGYLLQTGLVDYILGANCHPEIIVESANIVGFLVVTRTYRAEHTDQVWQGITSSQDPRVADALTRMMAHITNLFDYPGLLSLCNKFQLLPMERFSPSIRLLLDNVLSEMMTRSQTDQSTLSFHPYGLCLRLLRESSVCASGSPVADPEMQHVAMQKFRDLLGHGPDADGRRELYLSCIDDIAAKSATTLGSLWCLSMAIRHATVAQMQVLTEQHNLAKLIVEELDHAGDAGRAAGVFPVLSGTTNQPRRDFVSNLIQFQPEAIDNDLGTKLWDILVGPQSSCPDDRRAGWHIILSVARKATAQNPFLQTCFSKYLPKLPSAYFSEGMLEFIKERVHSLVNEIDSDFVFDDEVVVAKSGIEQLWRIILEAEHPILVGQAISTLAVDVYLESSAIMTYPLHRTRQVHLALVARCLRQMKHAAVKLKRSSDGTSSGDDEPMVIVATDDEIHEQERIFTRSLQLLRFFLEKYQSKPNFAVADLRSFMSRIPQQVEGDSAQLKYQSFDGDEQTDIMPLTIGKLNTVSSLLASLREETGFDNLRVYYRGRQLLPAEQDVCRPLQDVGIHDGFMLVKREENYSASPVRIKPGSLPLEIEVLAHFPELWEYLSMDDKIAEEIYDFVVKLPADGYVLSLFDTPATSYKDVFLAGRPFKSLYAIHALTDYIESVWRAALAGDATPSSERTSVQTSYEEALRRSLHLVVQALSDPGVLGGATARLQMRVASSLMQTFVKLVQGVYGSKPSPCASHVEAPAPARLVEILSNALDYPDDGGLPLIASAFSAILRVGQLDAQFWMQITEDVAFRGLIQKLLLFDSRKTVRVAVVELVEESTEVEGKESQAQDAEPSGTETASPNDLALYLWPIASELLPESVRLSDQCEEFFSVLRTLLLISKKLPGQVQFDKVAGQTSKLLLEHTSTEDVNQLEPYDSVASGLASVLHLCLQSDPVASASEAIPEDAARKLLWRHLFPRKVSDGADSVPPIILNSGTRAKLYEAIFRLVRQDRRQFDQILHLLNGLVPFYHDDNDDPYLYDLPYQFDRSKAMRSPCGYAGLRNLSNTCYLNSLLTQLYMNTEFRRFILGVPNRDPTNSQQLLFYTQKVFGFMQESYRRFVDPTSLVNSIKTYEDTVIDIHSQMDVDEFYSLLFDRWEGQLLRPEDKRKLRSFYGGQLVQQVKSKECEHISERLEPFSAIQCDIKGKGTLEESLQAYVDGEIMEGDNKYKCSTCDRHVDAVKRACLKDIPDNVMFHLKRFDFNLRTLQRSKINDHFSFPPTIDLRPYTIEHLSDPSTDVAEDVFELVGVLVHSGTAESGHYYSYIRERPASAGRGNWVEFNDDVVTPWDPSLMASSTFGGPDHRPLYETNGVMFDKTYSAYMLFYQRASSLEAEQQAMLAQQLPAPLRVGMPPLLKEHIVAENTVILRRHCLFDPSHAIFVQNCFTQARCLEGEVDNDNPRAGTKTEDAANLQCSRHNLQNLAMEMTVSHLDQIVGRTKDTPFFDTFSNMLSVAIANCPKCALAFYDYFDTRHTAYRAVLQRSPEPHVRAFAGEALVHAAERIAAQLPHLYTSRRSSVAHADSYSDRDDMDDEPDLEDDVSGHSVMEGVVMLLNHLWQFFQLHLRSWDEYFGTILAFAKLGDREAGILLSEDYLVKALRIVAADTAMELPPNYARMLNNVLRRVNTRPPSYSAILALIDHLMAQLEPTLGPEVIVEHPSERLGREAPFPWTSEEVHAVHHHPEGQISSFFVEKLVFIDQAWIATDDIVGRLMATGGPMEIRVLNALRRNIQGEVSTQPMDAFLRAACRYIECTHSADRGNTLIGHIIAQARSLQNTEGAAFITFIKVALQSKSPSEEIARSRHDNSVRTIPTWAPYMLVYPDSGTRHETEQLIEHEVFRHSSIMESAADDTGADNTEFFDQVVRELGLKCLIYLREVHVKRRVKIERDAAWSILRVVGRCAPSYETAQELQGDEDVEFAAIQSEIMEPLRRLMVDEMEDDASDWEGSCASSDQMEANAAVPMQNMDDVPTHGEYE